MTGKSVEKLLRKLSARKYRWQMQKFVAEGEKVVEDIIQTGLKAEVIVSTVMVDWEADSKLLVSEAELSKLSGLDSGGKILAVFPFPEFSAVQQSIVVVLDRINDPGNLGTIIRCCDWFGIRKIYCSKGSVDAYNPKTVQSSMGSIARVEVVYRKEEEIYHEIKGREIWCAHMEGQSIYEIGDKFRKPSALVMGSESHGPSEFWIKNSKTLTIPRHENSQTESLNVAIATAIILSSFSRNI